MQLLKMLKEVEKISSRIHDVISSYSKYGTMFFFLPNER